jgi:hypothetical protein
MESIARSATRPRASLNGILASARWTNDEPRFELQRADTASPGSSVPTWHCNPTRIPIAARSPMPQNPVTLTRHCAAKR